MLKKDKKKLDEYVNFKLRVHTKHIQDHRNKLANKRLTNAFILCGVMLIACIGVMNYLEWDEKNEVKKQEIRNRITAMKQDISIYRGVLETIGIGGGAEEKELRMVLNDNESSGYERLLPKYNLSRYKKIFPDFRFPIADEKEALTVVSVAEFGKRPWGRGTQFHTGMDIVSPYDYRLFASQGGKVIDIGYNVYYGNWLVIEHEGFRTSYSHVSLIYVKVGEYVDKGKVIAMIGKTGSPKYCKGYHLHFEIQKLEGRKWIPYNFVANSLHKKRVYIKK